MIGQCWKLNAELGGLRIITQSQFFCGNTKSDWTVKYNGLDLGSVQSKLSDVWNKYRPICGTRGVW